MSLSVSPLGQTNNPGAQIITITAATVAYTLSTTQSGSIISIPALDAACVLNLPAVANSAGVSYTFVCRGTLGQTFTITPTTNCIRGFALQPNAVGVAVQAMNSYNSGAAAGTAAATLRLNANCVVGDRVQLNCDGVSWFAQGWSGLASAGQAMTFVAPA